MLGLMKARSKRERERERIGKSERERERKWWGGRGREAIKKKSVTASRVAACGSQGRSYQLELGPSCKSDAQTFTYSRGIE